MNKIHFLKDYQITFQRGKFLKWYLSQLFVMWMMNHLKNQWKTPKVKSLKLMDLTISFFKCSKKIKITCKIILKSARKKCKTTLIRDHFWINQSFKSNLLLIKNQIKSDQSLENSFMLLINQFKITKAHWRNTKFSKLKQAPLECLQLKFKWKLSRFNNTRFQITQVWKSIKFLS